MPNLDEIKARQARLGAPEKVNYLQFSEDVDDFYRNAPTDINWLVQEVERLLAEVKALKAEKESMAEEYSQRLSHEIDDYYNAWANQQVEMEQLKNNSPKPKRRRCWKTINEVKLRNK